MNKGIVWARKAWHACPGGADGIEARASRMAVQAAAGALSMACPCDNVVMCTAPASSPTFTQVCGRTVLIDGRLWVFKRDLLVCESLCMIVGEQGTAVNDGVGAGWVCWGCSGGASLGAGAV